MIFRVLIATVVLAPLPFGANREWAWSLMASVVGVLLIAWSVTILRGEQTPPVTFRRVWPVLVPFGLAVLWAALQAATVMPDAWHHPLWASAEDVLGQRVEGAISLNPEKTVALLLRLVSYGGIFWLAAQYGRNERHARTIVYAVAYAGAIYAVYGLAVKFSGAEVVLWFPKTAYKDLLTSTFINHNSYAAYAGLGLLCTVALLIDKLFIRSERFSSDRRERLREILLTVTEQAWPLIVCWVVIIAAIFLAESRGATIALAAGLAGLLFAIALTRKMSLRRTVTIIVVLLVCLGAFIPYSGTLVFDKFATTGSKEDRSTESRLLLYRRTIDAISDAPWLGTGYGTFPEVYRMYRTEALPEHFVKAHNTYLENTLELGVPAATALFGTFVILAGYSLVGARRRRRNAIIPAVGFGATVLLATHSVGDFSLQIPAIAATYSLLMGAAFSQSWSSQES